VPWELLACCWLLRPGACKPLNTTSTASSTRVRDLGPGGAPGRRGWGGCLQLDLDGRTGSRWRHNRRRLLAWMGKEGGSSPTKGGFKCLVSGGNISRQRRSCGSVLYGTFVAGDRTPVAARLIAGVGGGVVVVSVVGKTSHHRSRHVERDIVRESAGASPRLSATLAPLQSATALG